jgi:monovalent cation/proton antiporter MnhG/PhaG subunit
VIESAAGVAGGAVLFVGLALASIGLYGMFRKRSVFDQLHAAGLITGPGVILVMLASLASGRAEIATSAVLLIVFVLVTASLSTHAIALAAWRSGPGRPGRRSAAGEDAGAGTGARGTGMRVVVAYDGSPGADIATALVASLRWPRGSAIRLVRVLEGDLELFAEQSAPPADERALSSGTLTAAASALQRDGVAVDWVTGRGDAATAIADEAAQFVAHLVVIGSRGLGPVGTVLVGSVAAATVDAAPCSVLVAREPRVREAVLAVDGSPTGDEAVDATGSWPIFEGVPIAVIGVHADPQGYRQRHDLGIVALLRTAGVRRTADAAATTLIEAGRQATAHVRRGDAAAQIVAFAAARRADLIVVGTRRRTGLRRAILGSVGRSVLTSTQASVLIVKTGSNADTAAPADE